MDLHRLKKPAVMGILNVTPNSFYDGGKFLMANAAMLRAKEMIDDGVDIIDVGGESTGPGSRFVPLEEELRQVISIIKKIAPTAHKKRIFVSIDTYKAEVAEQALKAGADIVNDVTALRADPRMVKVIARYKVPIVIMYAKDSTPRTTRKKIHYRNVMKTVKNFLKKRIQFALKNGINKSQIIIDPGMGAFVSGIPKYSFEILQRLEELKILGFPILIGASRKSFLGGNIEGRLEKSLAASFLAMVHDTHIVRVHDTKETLFIRNFLRNISSSLRGKSRMPR